MDPTVPQLSACVRGNWLGIQVIGLRAYRFEMVHDHIDQQERGATVEAKRAEGRFEFSSFGGIDDDLSQGDAI